MKYALIFFAETWRLTQANNAMMETNSLETDAYPSAWMNVATE